MRSLRMGAGRQSQHHGRGLGDLCHAAAFRRPFAQFLSVWGKPKGVGSCRGCATGPVPAWEHRGNRGCLFLLQWPYRCRRGSSCSPAPSQTSSSGKTQLRAPGRAPGLPPPPQPPGTLGTGTARPRRPPSARAVPSGFTRPRRLLAEPQGGGDLCGASTAGCPRGDVPWVWVAGTCPCPPAARLPAVPLKR